MSQSDIKVAYYRDGVYSGKAIIDEFTGIGNDLYADNPVQLIWLDKPVNQWWDIYSEPELAMEPEKVVFKRIQPKKKTRKQRRY